MLLHTPRGHALRLFLAGDQARFAKHVGIDATRTLGAVVTGRRFDHNEQELLPRLEAIWILRVNQQSPFV